MRLDKTVVGHLPVLRDEVVVGLALGEAAAVVDGTVGLGGHAQAILDASGPDGRLLGIDADPDAVAIARERLEAFKERVVLVHGNFRNLEPLAASYGFSQANAVLLDLGVSSLQLSAAGRGFSFQSDAPLDMRMDPALSRTAADLVNELDEVDLQRVLREYGEEPRAGRVARAIVRARPVSTTRQLAALVQQAIGHPGERIHPATRTFQALRIAVNDELGSLALALEASLRVLRPGARLAVISFHSLEDRLVKQFFARESRDCVCPPALPVCVCGHRARLRLVGRAIKPSQAEVAANPRSRSARLRLAERLPESADLRLGA